MEIWKSHPKCDRVEFSNYGNVRHTKNKKPRSVSVGKRGYGTVIISVNKQRVYIKVHRAVAELFLAPPSEYMIEDAKTSSHGNVSVNHIDGNKMNNHYKNLEWCTHKENMTHAKENGLLQPSKGELNGRAVLTEDLVHKLCKSFESGMLPKEAVEVYGISRAQATKIRAGFAWRHIWEQYHIKVNRRGRSNDHPEKE